MHDRPRLARQVYVSQAEKSEFFKIVIELLCAKPQADVDKHRITRVLDTLYKCLAPMPSHFVAADLPVLHNAVTGTHEGVVQRHDALLQAGGRGDDLECRSGLISIIDAPVPPHLVELILEFLIRQCFLIHPRIQFIRVVQVEFRHIYHGVDLPVLRVHEQDGDTVRLLLLHCLQRRLFTVRLNIVVQAHLQRLPGDRFDPVLRHPVQLDPPGVSGSQDGSVRSF